METSTSGKSSNNGGEMMVARQKMVKLEDPFALKVGQVFTGFGIGCGIGIGVGRPLNIGAIPVLNEVMSAARGATDAFSGVGRHVNNSLRKMGAKNFEAGIGCGVGFGHGFGVGLAVKPGVVHQIQSSLIQAVTHVMMKLGISPSLPVGRDSIRSPLEGGFVNKGSYQNQMGKIGQLLPNLAENASESKSSARKVSSQETLASKSSEPKYSSRTEQVLGDFLENPLLKDELGEVNELADRLRLENNLLHMVLKHQQMIEELMQENEKLHQLLGDNVNVSPSKVGARYSSRSKSPCTECFDCRRKQRKR